MRSATFASAAAACLALAGLRPGPHGPESTPGGPDHQAALRLERHVTLPADAAVYFGSVSDADVWADGRIAVLDGLAKSIYVFDPNGAVTDTIGREGAGPGEMRLAANMAIGRDGRLAAADITNARITVWSREGEYLQSVRIPPGWTGLRHLTWNAGGMTYKVSTFGALGVSFYRVDLAGDSLALLLDIPGESIAAAGPTCTFCAYAVDPAGRLLVGAPDTLYQVSVLDRTGTVVSVYQRTDVAAVRRSQAELDALRRRLRRGPSRVEGEGGPPPEPDPFKPRMQGIGLDGLGRLWVQLNTRDGAPGALDVFGRDGEYRTTVPIDPTSRMLRIRGEWLLAAGESATGEPITLVYRIVG